MDTNDKSPPPSSQSGRLHRRRKLKLNPPKEEGSQLIKFMKSQQLLKTAEEERRKPKQELLGDCYSYILHLLPIKELLVSRCVCKLLNEITKPESFIKSHLSHSEPVLLFTTQGPISDQSIAKPFIVKVHAQKDEPLNLFKLQQPVDRSPDIYYLNFMEIADDGRSLTARSFNIGFSGRLLGSCNGLILFENEPKSAGLIVMNPVTRKFVNFPAGTLVTVESKESYGFTFDGLRKQHRIVHLFKDGKQVGCEILTVEKRRWKMVDGPSLAMCPAASGLFRVVDLMPISTMGALHWVPRNWSHAKTGVSMDVEQEKFFQLVLPEPREKYDGFIEMENRLCFVTCEKVNRIITIWILMSLDENRWSKRHCVHSISILCMEPLMSSRSGSCILFRGEKGVHQVGGGGESEDDADGKEDEKEVSSPYCIYDFVTGEVRRMKIKKGLFRLLPRSFIPHVNSLVSC